ncbi:hypothetical protein OEB99_00455 [Actinotalea sp. M2MS4P-6]|uniref:hypothetical protein n=1 Tax=Actinotalea sp. M2MS4P-6 TaxID=2983762 RepID=UPI0021E3B393|nr:hypothetical protein [Actinotalea sp. M2MS4P-6]MCV2392769.1 hypothetical protein [Actinotalea sp. M2MS4P-6]
MPTRLLLDGQDLRALMLRVRDEMGPDAKIVRAERVRTGGIAGFFAREHYELTVELPDRPGPRPARTRPAPEGEGPRPGGQLSEPVGIEALLAAADELDRTPQVSTDGDSFAQVLASVQQITAGGPSAVAAEAGSTAAASDGAEPDVPATAPAWFPATPRSFTASGEPAPVAPADGDPFAAAEVVPAEPAVAPAPATPPVVPAEPVAAEPEPGSPVRPAGPDGASVAALLELGVPIRLLAGFEDQDVPLSRVVRGFDRPADAQVAPGRLVVVAGPADLAVRTAVAMAHRAGLDGHDVVLAGDVDALPGHGRRVLTTAAAGRVRSRVTEDAPTIVALGVGATAAAALLLHALDPDEAWAALDARLRGVELRRWLRAVGARRPFDAVAANSTMVAQSPGTVLNLGVPVGWLDGLPVSPVVWAALLSERLADDARWD